MQSGINCLAESRKYAHLAVGRQERYSRYRGTARVDIPRLRLDRSRQLLSVEHVETLRKEYADRGCLRLEPAHRIAALVSQQELTNILSHSNISQVMLLHGADTGDKPPKVMLPVNATLRVLHGQHRLEAALLHLPPDDTWWTVDFFLDGKISVS